MHLEDIEYFVRVIDCQSINKAARELSLTQPALSASMNRMEQELGIKLLKRSYRGVIPTEAGEHVYQEAQKVLATIGNWYHLADENSTAPKGDVHIAAVPTACSFLTRRLLSTQPPGKQDIQLFFHQFHRNIFFEQLFTGKANIGIYSIYSYELNKTVQTVERQGWRTYILYEENREILMSVNNPLADKPSLLTEDLRQLTLACYSFVSDNIKSQYIHYFNDEHCYYLDGENSVLQLVAENKAVAVYAPKILRDHFLLQNGAIIAKPLADLVLPATYLLLCPPDEALSPAEKATIERIKAEFLELNS